MLPSTPKMAENEPNQGKPEPEVVELYANVVAANVTPLDFNLVFSRMSVPVNSPDGAEANLLDHVKPIARVAMPVLLLPLVLKVLQKQLDSAIEKGLLKPSGMATGTSVKASEKKAQP